MFVYWLSRPTLNRGSNPQLQVNQDLYFLKTLKEAEKVDAAISKAALNKFSHQLWYFCEEAISVSLFDDEVDEETTIKMTGNMNRDSRISWQLQKRYVLSKEELT